MRPMKRLITALAASACMISCAALCYAEGEDNGDNNNYVVTTTTGTSAQGQNGVVWTQLPPSSPAKELEDQAVSIALNVSNIEDNKFTASLDINTKEKLTLVEGSLGYDVNEYRLLSAQAAPDDSGTLTDEKTDGKYSFKYTCEGGSQRSGQYILFTFELIKEAKKDDVLFLNIASVKNDASESVSFNKTDGIVSPTSSPNIAQDVRSVRLAQFARPYTFEELGFADIINCEIEGSDVAKFSEGGIVAMTPGTVNAKLIRKDYTIQRVKIEVYSAQGGDAPAADDNDKDSKKAAAPKAKLSVNLGVPVLLCLALVFAEYLVILKPRHKRAAASKTAGQRPYYDPRYNNRPRQNYDQRNYRR